MQWVTRACYGQGGWLRNSEVRGVGTVITVRLTQEPTTPSGELAISVEKDAPQRQLATEGAKY